MSTWYSIGRTSAADSWREIRTSRAEPIGQLAQTLASDANRRREFHMALEQAQQQFSASGSIGYESRPLNLFYGLSQAGRALSAGSPRLGGDKGGQWQGSGHGLKFDPQVPAGVFEAKVKGVGGARDLFSRASTAINSPSDFGSVELGAVVNQLVDYTMAFPDRGEYPRPVHGVRLSSVHSPFPTEIEVPVPGVDVNSETSAHEVRRRLGRYAPLQGLDIAVKADGSVKWSHNAGRCLVVLKDESMLEWGSRDGERYLKGTADYRGVRVLLPYIGENSISINPLMSWWLALYALSVLARYSPSKWTSALSISKSPISSRIEFLLDSALDAVPDLVRVELNALQS